jgi:putative membrane protein
MDLSILPPLLATLNTASLILLISGLVAILRRDKALHRKIMLVNLGLAAGFLAVYVVQVVLVGHERYPGEGALRSFFLGLLLTHTVLAVSLLGLVPRTVYLAFRGRFESHKRIARVTAGIWLYVSFTGIIVYLMLHHLPTTL